MKWTRVIAVTGVLLLVTGVLLLWSLRTDRLDAERLDRNREPHGPVTGTPAGCGQLVEPEVMLPRRVMGLHESQALTIALSSSAAETCEVIVTLNAPGFRLSPPEPRRQVTVGPARRVEIAWVLLPEEVGTYDLVLTIGGALTVLGVTVTNILGLTAAQLQILSAITTFLGPILTAPWWVEQWQAWRARRNAVERRESPAPPFE